MGTLIARRRRARGSGAALPGPVGVAAASIGSGPLALRRERAAGSLQEFTVADALMQAAGRDFAMLIPAVADCRNLIVGAVSQMDAERYRGQDRLDPGTLLTQPDPDCTWVETIAATVEDLLFYGCAYWIVLAFDGQASDLNPEGLPVRARHLPYGTVAVTYSDADDWQAYRRPVEYAVGTVPVPASHLIRFQMVHEGVLRYGAATIKHAAKLEDRAGMFASVEIPAGILQNEGQPLSEEEAQALVAQFQAARQENSVAFLQSIKYERASISPADLDLTDSRAAAATNIARLFSVPVVMISASPTGNTGTSLLYANVSQNLSSFVSSAVAPVLRVLEQTLSLPTVTARGQKVAFAVGQFLRSDPSAAVDYATTLFAAGLITDAEARAYLGIPATPVVSDLTPGRV